MKYTAVALLISESGAVQLNGFPVHVNPESVLYANTQAATDFGFVDIPIGLDEVNFAQTEEQGFPIHVNPESVLYTNDQAATNFGFIDIPVGLDEVSFLQTQHSTHIKQELHD
jgi:hypothetical protein|tara:strand:- start:484 stop:822 length:339 start_codon:yes stop_codon:yes gene_type:complete